MSIKYTDAQQKAIDTTNKSLLVSAAAGSGKTAVLVQRIIETVCKENGPDIDRLLVVTFTNAAAAEMKDKIYQAIMQKIAEIPSDKRLKRQLLLLPNANIQTMHGFCLNLIKQNINMLDIPVNFRIADETETALLKQKSIFELIEDKYASDDVDFLEFTDTYGYGRDDNKIAEMILNYYHFTSSLANPDSYFEKCMSYAIQVTEDFSKSVYAFFLISRLQTILSEHEERYLTALQEICERPDLSAYHELYSEELLFIKKLQKICDKQDLREAQAEILSHAFPYFNRVKGVKKGTDYSDIKRIRDLFKNDLNDFMPLIANSFEGEQADWKEILKFITVLSQLTKEFSSRYQREKQMRSVVDFSDFEHFALKILSNEDGSPSEIAKSYQNRFHEILIDEYQDTNDIQDYLFGLISKNGENLFLVGDVKQSIYGFRHAKPQIFIDKQAAYHDDKHEVIYLSNNFRSRKEVVDAVNLIFSKLMTLKTGKTDYLKESLVQTASYQAVDRTDYQAEILLADGSQKEEQDEETEEFNQETLIIAKRIHQLIHEEQFSVYDLKTKTSRPANYGDIVILVRGIKTFANNLYKTLSMHGIPVAMDATERLFDSMEIKVVLSILKAIDNPYDDLSLLALLKSPLFYWDEEEILALRDLSPKEPFIYALRKSNSLKAKQVLSFLRDGQKVVYSKKTSEFIKVLYQNYHLKELFCVYQNPEQRIENLNLFYQIAKKFEQTDVSGLKGFLLYLEDLFQNKKSLNAFREKPPENAVRIITMHKSKGLEYPIVFVAGLNTKFNQEEAKKQIVFHPEYGIGANYIDKDQRFCYPTLTKRVILAASKEDQLSEELRILYVALTRAKEKLILTSTVSNAETKLEQWATQTGEITKNSLLRCSSFAEWIMPCVMNSSVFRIETSGGDIDVPSVDVIAGKQPEEALSDPDYLFIPYHHLYRTTLPNKVAVTEANRLAKSDAPVVNLRLSDLDSMELTYSQSEYGTYFHKVFELIDLNAIRQGSSVSDAILNAISLTGEKEYSKEVAENIASFFQTEFAKKMLASDSIYREKSFLVRIPAKKVYPVDTDDEILLQGVCDCYFIKNNQITLLDFKTDRNPDEEKIRKNYQKQLDLYGYALEKIEEKKVVEKVIYTSANQQFIHF